ncbi:MAG TPA: thioredoxin domain-containing protein, partial [Polyangiaceae bacterium]|nr:thioredoxin domain-containing protein [Polyangiaceae bacterium]
ETELREVKKKYGPEKLRIVWKHNPLVIHHDARPASLAGATVFALGGSRAFFKFHDAAFANQKALNDDNFAAWAVDAGVDRAAFQAAYTAKEQDAKVDQDLAAGRKVGVGGTPAAFVNGISLNGLQPASEFEKLIDAELEKADKLVASGVAKDELYVKLSQANVAEKPLAAAKSDRPADAPLNSEKAVWRVPVGASPVRGPADALVTIVELADFECRFSAEVEPTLKAILADHAGKVRLVYKHRPIPFHERAIPAANLAVLARRVKGDDGFWAAHDLLFAKQGALKDEDLVAYGAELGLDPVQVKEAIKKPAGSAIEDDVALADELEAAGTPYFFINGRRLVGAQQPAKIRSLVDEELEKAEKRVSTGIAAADLYANILQEAKEMPALEKKTIAAAPADAPFKGNPTAKVEMHIWSDFQCPYCKKAEGTLTQVEKDFGDRVKFIWRDKPLEMHKQAPLAAQAAREALKQKGPEVFWAFHDDLFKIQGADFGRAGFDKLAEKHGLDMKAFGAALDSGAHAAAVDASAKEGDRYGVTGTPTFIVTYKQTDAGLEGYFMAGAAPYAKFKRLLRTAIAEVDGSPHAAARDDLPIPAPEPSASVAPSASPSASAPASASATPSASPKK